MKSILAVASLVLLNGGCALTSKADALSPRYFSPQATTESHAQPVSQPVELRLGQVSSASNLDERIAYRLSAVEVGFYEDRRWTELPEAYLRRALEKQLFEQRKVTRVLSGLAPILDVELVAFEEQRSDPAQVRVVISYGLRDEARSLLERRLVLERPVTKTGGDAAARAAQSLAETMEEAVSTVSAEVVQQLMALKTESRTTGAPSTDTSRPSL